MRHLLLAICSWVLVGGVFAQSTPDSSTTLVVEYPYNPDSNGDASIGTPDLLDFLPGFNSSFQPQSIMVDSITLEAWLLMLQARLDDLEANGGLGFGRDDVARWVFGKELAGTDFGGLDLRYSAFPHADLQGANFANAQLQGADLRWADMSGANFYGANFGPNNDCSRFLGNNLNSNSAYVNTESVFDGANLACLRGCGCLPPGWVCIIDEGCSELRYKWVRPDVVGLFLFSDSIYDGMSARGEVFLPGSEGTASVSGSSFIGASISRSELSMCPFINCDFTDARIDTSITAGIAESVMEGFEASQWQGGNFDGCNLNGARLNFAEEAGPSEDPARIQNCTAQQLQLEGDVHVDLAVGNQIERLQVTPDVKPYFFSDAFGEATSHIDSLFVHGQDGVTAQDMFDQFQESNAESPHFVNFHDVGIQYLQASNGKLFLYGECTDVVADSSLLQLSNVSAQSVELLDCILVGNCDVEVVESISFAGCDAGAASFSRIERVSVCPDVMPDGWVCETVDEECGGNGLFVIRSDADSLQTVEWFGSDGDVITGCDAFLNSNYSYNSTLFDSIVVVLPEDLILVGDYFGDWYFDSCQFVGVNIQGGCLNPEIYYCNNGIIQMGVTFSECDFLGSELDLTILALVNYEGGHLMDSAIELFGGGQCGLFADSVVDCDVQAEQVQLAVGVAHGLTVQAEDYVALNLGEYDNLVISTSVVELTNDGPLELSNCVISANTIFGSSSDESVVTEILQGITAQSWEDGLQLALFYDGSPITVALDSVSTCPTGIQFPWACSDESGAVIITSGN